MLEEGVEDRKPWNDTVPDGDIGIGCSTGNMLNEPDVSRDFQSWATYLQ